MALGSTQSLTEMSTRYFPGDKGRPVLKANNITRHLCVDIVDVSQPYGPPWPVTRGRKVVQVARRRTTPHENSYARHVVK
jgi:hypothetical protein